jgi:hypothetical protein
MTTVRVLVERGESRGVRGDVVDGVRGDLGRVDDERAADRPDAARYLKLYGLT